MTPLKMVLALLPGQESVAVFQLANGSPFAAFLLPGWHRTLQPAKHHTTDPYEGQFRTPDNLNP
jgi:hypothetical protein